MFSYVYTCPPQAELFVFVKWNSFRPAYRTGRFMGTRFIVISLFSFYLKLVVINRKYSHQCDRVNV
ncbi:MAG: hypothetical protein WBH40_11990, partial [Ignavibacteriaceae bacterium]